MPDLGSAKYTIEVDAKQFQSELAKARAEAKLYADSTAKALDKPKAKLSEFGKEMERARGSSRSLFSGMSQDAQGVGREMNKLQYAFANYRGASEKSIDSVTGKLSKQLDTVKQLKDTIKEMQDSGGRTTPFEISLRRMQKEADATTKKLDGMIKVGDGLQRKHPWLASGFRGLPPPPSIGKAYSSLPLPAMAAPFAPTLVGGLAPLIGSAGYAAAGAGALGAAGAGAGAVGLGSLMLVLKTNMSQVQGLSAAWDHLQQVTQYYGKNAPGIAAAQNKLNIAIATYGAGSRAAVTAQTALNVQKNTPVGPQVLRAQNSYNMLLKDANPQAAGLAKQLYKLHQAWQHATKGTLGATSNFLKPFADLALKMAPVISNLANQSLKALTAAFAPFVTWLQSPAFKTGLSQLESTFVKLSGPAVGAFANIFKGIMNIAIAAGPWLVQVVQSFQQWTAGFAAATQPGQKMTDIMTKIHDNTHAWFELIKNTGHVIFDFFNISAGSGKSMVDSLNKIMVKWDHWMHTTKGQQALHDFFKNSVAAVTALATGLAPLVGAFLSLTTSAGPGLTVIFQALTPLIQGIASGVTAISKALPAFARLPFALAIPLAVVSGWKALRAIIFSTEVMSAGIAAGPAGAATAAAAGRTALAAGGAGAGVSALGGAGGGALAGAVGKIGATKAVLTKLGFAGLAGGATYAITGALGIGGPHDTAGNIARAGATGAATGAVIGTTLLPGLGTGVGALAGGVIGAGGAALSSIFGHGGPSALQKFQHMALAASNANDPVGLKKVGDQAQAAAAQMRKLGIDGSAAMDKLAKHAHQVAAALPGQQGAGATQAGIAQFASVVHPSALGFTNVFQQQFDSLKKFGPKIQHLAGQQMLQYATELHRSGKLPTSEFKQLLENIKLLFPGFQTFLQQQGLASAKSWDQSMKLKDSKAILTTTLDGLRAQFLVFHAHVKSDGSNMAQAFGSAMDQLHIQAQSKSKSVREAAINEMNLLQGQMSTTVGAMASTGSQQFWGFASGAIGAMQAIGKNTNQALSALGLHPKRWTWALSVTGALGAAAQAAAFKSAAATHLEGGSNLHAGGGIIGNWGERGRDNVPIVVGRGEAILNHPQQRPVETALAASKMMGIQPFGSLSEVFGGVTAKHYASGGLTPMGGAFGSPGKSLAGSAASIQAFPFPKGTSFTWQRIDQGQDLQETPGAPVLAIGPGTVSQASDRFGGFGPFYPTEQITGGPLAGRGVYYGHTKIVKTGAVNAGDVIAYTQSRANEWTAAPAGWLELGFLPYGGMNAGAAIAPYLHQLASGAQVTAIGGGGGVGAAAARLATPILKRILAPGTGALHDIGQGAIDKVLKAAQNKVNKAYANQSGGNFGGVTGTGGTSGQNQALGKQMMMAAGWPASEWPSLQALWTQESGWSSTAVNSSSGAYGIPQSLGHGHPYNLGDARAQIAWGLNYIKGRYGSPSAAEAHERASNWYAGGGFAGGPAWDVTASAESYGGLGYHSNPIQGRGYSELSMPPSSLNFSALGNIAYQTPMVIGANGKTVVTGKQDIGAGSSFLPEMGLYPQTMADLGLGGGQNTVRIQRQDGQPLHPMGGHQVTIPGGGGRGRKRVDSHAGQVIIGWREVPGVKGKYKKHRVPIYGAKKLPLEQQAITGLLGVGDPYQVWIDALENQFSLMGSIGGSTNVDGSSHLHFTGSPVDGGPSDLALLNGHPALSNLAGVSWPTVADGEVAFTGEIQNRKTELGVYQQKMTVWQLGLSKLKAAVSARKRRQRAIAKLMRHEFKRATAIRDLLAALTTGDLKSRLNKAKASDARAVLIGDAQTSIRHYQALIAGEKGPGGNVAAVKNYEAKIKSESAYIRSLRPQPNATAAAEEAILKNSLHTELSGIDKVLVTQGGSSTKIGTGGIWGALQKQITTLTSGESTFTDGINALQYNTIPALNLQIRDLYTQAGTGGGALSANQTLTNQLQAQQIQELQRSLLVSQLQLPVFQNFVGSFAVGTTFVPQTGMAQVHKGEAIIPAEVNPFGRGGGANAPEIHIHGLGDFVDRVEHVVDGKKAEISSFVNHDLASGARARRLLPH